MNDIWKGFFMGLGVGALFLLLFITAPGISCRSNFEQEAVGNNCAVWVCDTNGSCEFKWTCGE